jgi:vancomycin aglycone glucosyltransferase
MRIALVVYGSRGDVQPMMALALGLINKGHEAILYATPENEEFALQYNCPFVPFGKNLKEIFKNAEIKGGITVKLPPKEGKQLIEYQINTLSQLIKNTDLILGAGIILGVPTVADFLNIPYRLVAFYPILLGTTRHDPLANRIMFCFGRSAINLVIKGFINKQRAGIGLKPIKDVWQNWMGDNVILACDKELNPARKDVAFPFTQTGYILLPSKEKLPQAVEEFLNLGKPPVYIGFGSNPVTAKEKFDQIFNQVSNETNQRLIVSKGWADLPGKNTPEILYVDEIPFEYLFPRLSAIIYHGGTGTLA